jgi:acyl carrier protein
MDSIRQDVRTFIISNFMFGQGGDNLADDQSFLETGVIDSTGVLELISFLEQQFGIAVEDQEVVPANLDSVSQLVDFVQRKAAARGAQVAG